MLLLHKADSLPSELPWKSSTVLTSGQFGKCKVLCGESHREGNSQHPIQSSPCSFCFTPEADQYGLPDDKKRLLSKINNKYTEGACVLRIDLNERMETS
ncbi:hypothetical protein CapIbe_000084 [Capra ibex]